MAAVLACGPDAVLSHRDAAALWGVRSVSGTRIDVTAPTRSHAPRGITLHRAKLAPQDRTTRDNIPTTSLARTFLDLASRSPLDAVVRALEEAERQRLIDMRHVYATLETANGHPGSGRLAQAINAYEPRHLRTRSDLERAFLQLCANAGLPKPQVNARLGAYESDAPLARAAPHRRARRLRDARVAPVVRERPHSRRDPPRGGLPDAARHGTAPRARARGGRRSDRAVARLVADDPFELGEPAFEVDALDVLVAPRCGGDALDAANVLLHAGGLTAAVP
jgi:hypothetical protein